MALNEGIRISSLLYHLERLASGHRQTGKIAAPHRVTSDGAVRLQAMLQTKQAQQPSALVQPVPVAVKTPVQSVQPARRYPQPD
ncbi:hypothetical protein [Pseudoduganella lutea]|uniref:Uncharacterized protein n=1 Tax=Pseudoduganella lutea TaxID=321985 RepID=A0A4P6L524_9BURK|nr:hypothetical protein [Pseudoduganella lutea]QBE66445.1 hypothetical protein EWM63_28645 [Pseudoduganella lutea]